MSVDTYAICPCGSGKKIKFCKCKDSVGELDRILKMVEGGQLVPALDRLATVLTEHPDAAWALAVRGRLLLDLREYESLAENADRFIRLQPSNPLALTQGAAAELFRGNIPAATESMLEALTESGRDVDAFVLDVSSVLAFSLVQSGVYLTARVYAMLGLMASDHEENNTALSLLRQLNSAPTVNQLLKTIPEPIARPTDVEWGERYDEASALLQSNKVVLAQSKLESLQRIAPAQPAILSGLLTCAVWRGDTDAQSDLLKKLSACDSLDFEDRCRYRALSALVPPGTPELSIGSRMVTAEIENPDEVVIAMTADARFVALPTEMLSQMKVSEDDIPPRAGFQIIDRDKPESLETLPPVDEIPEAIAMLFVYGKQTDRAARINVLDIRESDLAKVRERLESVLGDVSLTEEEGDPLPLLVACQPPVAMIRFQGHPAAAETLQNEVADRRVPEMIGGLHLPILDGKSLVELADDSSKLLERTTVVRIIQQYDAIVAKSSNVVQKVCELANIEPQPALKPNDDEIESLSNEDLNRVDPSDLNAESLVYLLQRSQQVSATPAVRRVAKQVIETELPTEQGPVKLLAYATLVNAASTSTEALTTLEEAKAFAETHEMSTANLLLSEISLRLQSGDSEGFQRALQSLTTKYRNEPEVMAQLQQMLMSYGLIRPDGSPRSAAPPAIDPGAAPANESALWTPDSAAPASAKGGEGGGKLWIPGMD